MRDRIGRAMTVVLLVGASIAMVACPPTPGDTCGDGYCAAGMQCAQVLNGGTVPRLMCVVPNVCGNGVPEFGEVCDDGNTVDGDGCSHDCKSNETCGNRITDIHEVCDDGNTVDGDGCSHDCQSLEICGNGVVDAGEECDGAAGLQPCSATCHQERCGNGILDPGEQCDDGGTDDGDGCSHDCKFEFCGDGIVNDGEACDRALTPATCNLDCTMSRCGDGKLNVAAGEQCDDGGTGDGNGCSATCTFEHCGNGVVDAGEECDGAAGLQPCSATCHQERCGNGILDNDPATAIAEQCDDGNHLDGDGCSHDCKFEFCGDGVINNREVCDSALTPATCNLDCTVSVCGDGKANLAAGEQCDLGSANNDSGVCTTTCQFSRCGDDLVETGVEQCDSGAGNSDQGDCTSGCRSNVCGDGFVDSLGPDHIEQCDDGASNTDTPACRYNATCIACSVQCQTLTVHHRCGDGVVDAPDEACDDHNTDACGSCSATCGVVTSHRAFGIVLAVSGSELSDGETFTLDDGVNPVEVFEFDAGDGVADDHVAVLYDAGSTARDVRQAIVDAIQAEHDAGRQLIAPDPDPSNVNDALVLLIHDRPTSLGNHMIVTDVATPTFIVAGMAGGQGGDCNDDVACSSDDDCASHHCNAQHVCDTPQVTGSSDGTGKPATAAN